MAFEDTKLANMTLAGRQPSLGVRQTILAPWTPMGEEDASDSFILVMGPDDLESESVRKFFRGIQVFGTGTAYAVAFVDGEFVKEGQLTLSKTATHTNLFWLPRGTNGFEVMVILCVTGRLENIKTMVDGSDNLEAE